MITLLKLQILKIKITRKKMDLLKLIQELFFSKREKNQWKNELNVKQIKKLENKFRDFMNKFGYD